MNRKMILGGLTALMLGFAPLSNAVETPSSLDGVTIVTAEAVKDMLAKGVKVIDARSANEFAEAHIKGAVSVPYKEKSKKEAGFDASQDSFDVSKLPSDKAAPVVFYCNAGDCWKSYKASAVAVKAGHSKVHWFRGGMPEWKSKNMPVE